MYVSRLTCDLHFQVRDWYVESFRELKNVPPIKDTTDEAKFTELLRVIFQRHAHVVPTMARSVPTASKTKQSTSKQ